MNQQLVEPRPKSDWVPDSDAPQCMICRSKFTLTKRVRLQPSLSLFSISFDSLVVQRHHCRLCARVVCGACSRPRARTKKGEKVRACDECIDTVSLTARVK